MRDSIIIVLFFIGGLILSFKHCIPTQLLEGELSTWILYVLLFVVGVSVGSDKNALNTLYKVNWRILLVPVVTVIGSLGGVALLSLFFNEMSVREAMAVGAGFGYYSLSSVLISEMHSHALGTIGLLSNVIREMLTLLLAPLMVRYFGKLAPIAAGGATAMDTTLPIITQSSGNDYALIAVFSGLVLSIIVPLLVTFILSY